MLAFVEGFELERQQPEPVSEGSSASAAVALRIALATSSAIMDRTLPEGTGGMPWATRLANTSWQAAHILCIGTL
eukprot:7163353-Alexandrium_andersonii.AAC.1